MLQKRYLLLIILITAAAGLQARPITDFLPHLSEEEISRVEAGGIISFDSTLGEQPTLTPCGTTIEQAVEELEVNEHTLFTEFVTMIPYPDYFSDLTLREQLVHTFNTLRSVSTQEGITYISQRRGGEPALLIEESHVTDRVGGRKELPDPVMDILPVEASMIVFQKDTSFKNNYFSYEHRNTYEELYLQVTNKTPMRVLGFIPAVDEEVLSINTSLIFADEGILAYSAAVAADQKAEISILGMGIHLPTSFQNRIIAIMNWFTEQLNSTRPDFS